MNRKEIRHIISGYISELNQYAGMIWPGADVEAIHQFRVSYKKLRAFLRMLNEAGAAKQTCRMPRKIKQLYALLGDIRDLQMQQQLIIKSLSDTVRPPDEYLGLIQKHIDVLCAELPKSGLVSHYAKGMKKLEAASYKSLSQKFMKHYIDALLGEVSRMVRALSDDEGLHACRKKLKDYQYNIRHAKETKKPLPDSHHFSEQLKWLLEALGGFQDYCVAIVIINRYLPHVIDVQSRQAMYQVKDIWQKEQQRLRTGLLPVMHIVINDSFTC